MSLWRRAARTDSTQAEIVEALRHYGCVVEVIRKPVDLLVGDLVTGRWYPVEVKAPKGTLRKAQEDFIDSLEGRLECPVFRSAEEAVTFIRLKRGRQ